jgi:hypothetical protein
MKKATQHRSFGRIGFGFKHHIQFIDDVGLCYFMHERPIPDRPSQGRFSGSNSRALGGSARATVPGGDRPSQALAPIDAANDNKF